MDATACRVSSGGAHSGAAQPMTALIAFSAFEGLGAGGLAVGAFWLIGAPVPPAASGAAARA
ncbi:hypothetical protein [Streptomyces sp. NPDC088910]|uniref:hypothetical protein n=1 Tax=Streptomyces sp. NPDC088910 TaxID=3365911 RepID=UPI0037FA00BA